MGEMVAMIVVRCDVPEDVKQDLSTLVSRDDRKGIRAVATTADEDSDNDEDDDGSDEDDDPEVMPVVTSV